MHAPQHPGALQHGEVPADGLGGDAEALGDGSDGDPAPVGDQARDGALAFLCVHGTSPTVARPTERPVMWETTL